MARTPAQDVQASASLVLNVAIFVATLTAVCVVSGVAFGIYLVAATTRECDSCSQTHPYLVLGFAQIFATLLLGGFITMVILYIQMQAKHRMFAASYR